MRNASSIAAGLSGTDFNKKEKYKMNKVKIKTNGKFEEGKCPLCGGELEYVDARELDDSGSSIPWECTQCGARGSEGYSDVFDSHYSVQNAEGCEIEFEPIAVEPLSDDDLLCEAGDTIDNAVQDLLNALSVTPVEWDMSLIAQVKNAAESILKARNIPVCIPWENEDGHICYSLPNERCAHCPRSCTIPDKLTIAIHDDDDVVMSIYDDVLRVDWYNAGEGICGDFNPDDPKDVNLLRFDVYIKGNEDGTKEWLEVTDASYCTNMPATAPEAVLEKALKCIFKRYRDVISGPTHPSVKKLGEELSHISEDDFSTESPSAGLSDASAEPAENAIPAILVERDYKGEYERFALTEEEFQREFPETYAHFGPIKNSNADTLRPLVHIWFCPCFVGDEVWTRFFTDMADGLPDSDIERGNLATVNKDLFGELLCYLPDNDTTVDNRAMTTAIGNYMNVFDEFRDGLDIIVLFNEANTAPPAEEISILENLIAKEVGKQGDVPGLRRHLTDIIEASGLDCVEFGVQVIVKHT